MAYILLLDESDVASRAMQGILARGNHTCFAATTPDQAWRMLREGVVFDLVFLDLKTAGNTGMAFLQRLRDDWFWKIMPVVVYTYEAEVKHVRKALGLKVQNYLIKPYNDQLIHAEVAKATSKPWRNLHFEEAKAFCAQMDITEDGLIGLRREVMVGFDEAARTYPGWAVERDNTEVSTRISELAKIAEAAGIWGGVDFLRDLQAHAELGNWSVFRSSAEYLDFASRLIFCQVNPSYVPESMCTQVDGDQSRETSERAIWEHADVNANGPLIDAADLEKHVRALSGCPVINTAAASFQMGADGRATSIGQIVDLVSADPGLCAQVLMAVNRTSRDEMTSIDDPRAAVSRLGEIKLSAIAKALPIVSERVLDQAPLTWPNFWMFQNAVAKVAEFICNYLELSYLAEQAHTAGLLHDIGKLLLLKVHPFGFQTIVRYSRDQHVPLAEAERKYLGCTTRDLAVHFVENGPLPAVYVDVIRWVETPENISENMDLVAIVSLARHICMHNHVGYCGETSTGSSFSISSTAAWQVLQRRLFPSFDLKKFEAQSHAYCMTLRQVLSGKKRADVLVA